MQLSVSVDNSDILVNTDVSGEMTLADFKAYMEAETGIPPTDQILSLNGKPLDDDNKTLDSLGVKNNDLLALASKSRPSTTQSPTPTSAVNAPEQIELIRQQLVSNPLLRQQFPPQIDDLINDPEQFKTWFQTYVANNPFGSFASGSHSPASTQRNKELERLQRDPDNPENQKKILELIQQEQIDENMRNALEYSPETFATVNMLYVDVELNGHKVKAFVDSGAQKTILSPKLAAECGLDRLIDKRFRGQAKGVGSGQILGQIHSATIKVASTFFPCSFTILDTDVDFLLGLDMLKRHRGIIDLNRNVLVLGDAQTEFLPESEIPKSIFSAQPAPPGTQGGLKLGGNIFSPDANTAPGTVKKQKVATSAAANAAIARNNSTNSSNKYPEATITQLQGLGFTKDQVIRALDQSGGNAEFAAAILFQ